MSSERAIGVNPTAAALLGLLHDGPMTGGRLVAAAEHRFGGFFSVTRSQVYRELPALVEAGLLCRGEPGPRASQQFVLTPTGRRAFTAWLAARGSVDGLRSPLVLRLLHAEALTPAQRAELVGHARVVYVARLTAARATARGEPHPYRNAVAEFAVAHARAMVRLLESIPIPAPRSEDG